MMDYIDKIEDKFQKNLTVSPRNASNMVEMFTSERKAAQNSQVIADSLKQLEQKDALVRQLKNKGTVLEAKFKNYLTEILKEDMKLSISSGSGAPDILKYSNAIGS